MFSKIKNFFQPEPKIKFSPLIPGLDTYMPIIPARDFKPRWLDAARADFTKNLSGSYPTKKLTSVHRCPGIISLLQTGWILRAWQDITIATNGDGVNFKWHVPVDTSHYQPTPDVSDIIADRMPKRENTLSTVIKLNSPWYVDLPANWNLLFVPLLYGDDIRFTSAPGILDSTIDSTINIQLFWHCLNSTEVIRAGTPLIHLVPILKKQSLAHEVAEYNESIKHRQFQLGYKMYATHLLNYNKLKNDDQ